VRVITGPNMSGKSCYLRQAALIVLLAQMGSFVPAEAATLGVVDRIFTRIGAQDEIHAGQSTFMVEMVEAANILHHATPRSLLVFDEIGRGTSTYDGVSLAWAIVEHIHNHPKLKAKTLFATHYHELTDLEDILPRVKNFHVTVAEERGKIKFLRQVVPGKATKSYGVQVAKLAGLPRPVVHRAEEILAGYEAGESSSSSYRRVAESPADYQATPRSSQTVLDELLNLDIDSMTPVEAITKLYELKKKAGEGM